MSRLDAIQTNLSPIRSEIPTVRPRPTVFGERDPAFREAMVHVEIEDAILRLRAQVDARLSGFAIQLGVSREPWKVVKPLGEWGYLAVSVALGVVKCEVLRARLDWRLGERRAPNWPHAWFPRR